MNRIISLGLAAALVTGLAACVAPTNAQVGAIVGGIGAVGAVTGQQELIGKVRARVDQVCSFVPAQGVVSAVIGTFREDLATTALRVEEIAAGICAAVRNPSASYASRSSETERRGTYRNVRIRGTRSDGR